MFSDARSTYLTSSVTTASPARLLVMLCDRMVLDIQRALESQEAGDFNAAHGHLVHAQDVVAELSTSLRPDLWEGGPRLHALYTHLHGQLVHANVHRDMVATQHCLNLTSELADTWRTAAMAAAAATAAS